MHTIALLCSAKIVKQTKKIHATVAKNYMRPLQLHASFLQFCFWQVCHNIEWLILKKKLFSFPSLSFLLRGAFDNRLLLHYHRYCLFKIHLAAFFCFVARSFEIQTSGRWWNSSFRSGGRWDTSIQEPHWISPNLPPHSEIPINPIGGSPSPGLPSFQPLPIGGTTHFTSASGQYVKASEAKQKKKTSLKSAQSCPVSSFYRSKLGGELLRPIYLEATSCERLLKQNWAFCGKFVIVPGKSCWPG